MPVLHSAPTRSRAVAAAVLVGLALVTGGCSSDSSTPVPASGSSTSSGDDVRPVVSKVVLGKVAGTIHKENRKVFRKDHRRPTLKKVGRAVDTWIDGGFVGVDYPRDSFGSAFAAFTKPAKHDARRQKELLTNWDLRHQIDGVDVKRRTVTVDVLAPRGRPAGATARIALVFTTSGDTEKRVVVKGRLFLTPDHGSWRIFGYDVSRGSK